MAGGEHVFPGAPFLSNRDQSALMIFPERNFPGGSRKNALASKPAACSCAQHFSAGQDPGTVKPLPSLAPKGNPQARCCARPWVLPSCPGLARGTAFLSRLPGAAGAEADPGPRWDRPLPVPVPGGFPGHARVRGVEGGARGTPGAEGTRGHLGFRLCVWRTVAFPAPSRRPRGPHPVERGGPCGRDAGASGSDSNPRLVFLAVPGLLSCWALCPERAHPDFLPSLPRRSPFWGLSGILERIDQRD
ncbi:collagen alpha-1(I) chain-like [Nomascus leucogenys]|uniref:collagen alpha-1(I) chain-like n=1 Tax=Nomascus leucogenys TaxID=61853 RepID=UPI00122DB96E|nr:collagen alpha-1(I) chain-like [Nomascus leucogenys]